MGEDQEFSFGMWSSKPGETCMWDAYKPAGKYSQEIGRNIRATNVDLGVVVKAKGGCLEEEDQEGLHLRNY